LLGGAEGLDIDGCLRLYKFSLGDRLVNLAADLDIGGVIRKVSEYRPIAGVAEGFWIWSLWGGMRSVWISTRWWVLYGKFLDNYLLATLSDQAV
jgi:hypothetical protein